jgi:hypothetical protein
MLTYRQRVAHHCAFQPQSDLLQMDFAACSVTPAAASAAVRAGRACSGIYCTEHENLRSFFTRRQVNCSSFEIELQSASGSLRHSAQPVHLVVQRERHRVFEINHGHGHCAAERRRDERRRGRTCETL